MEVKEQLLSNLIVKVLYKKQTFNFGKNITSYGELFNQAKQRFPEIKDVAFVFEEKEVTDKKFMNALKEQQAKGLKSIKLQLKEAQFVKLQEKPQPSEKAKTKRYFFDSNIQEKDKTKKLENQSKQESKKSDNPKKKSFSFNQSSEGEEDFQNLQIDPDQIKITVEIKQESSRIKSQVGSEYLWSCRFTNEGKIQVPKSVYVRELIGFKLIQIGGLKIGQTKEITFGPYTETKEGQILHFFQIVYRTNEDTRYVIGSKFGFVCDAFKKIPVKEISNKLTDKVNELKNFTACEKSTLYIVAKMKEMGINDTTVDRFADEDLVDMIESFNEQ